MDTLEELRFVVFDKHTIKKFNLNRDIIKILNEYRERNVAVRGYSIKKDKTDEYSKIVSIYVALEDLDNLEDIDSDDEYFEYTNVDDYLGNR